MAAATPRPVPSGAKLLTCSRVRYKKENLANVDGLACRVITRLMPPVVVLSCLLSALAKRSIEIFSVPGLGLALSASAAGLIYSKAPSRLLFLTSPARRASALAGPVREPPGLLASQRYKKAMRGVVGRPCASKPEAAPSKTVSAAGALHSAIGSAIMAIARSSAPTLRSDLPAAAGGGAHGAATAGSRP